MTSARPASDGEPLRVLLVTQSTSRDRLLNALVDYSDAAALTFELLVLKGNEGPLFDDMTRRSVSVSSLAMTSVDLKSVPRAAFWLSRLLRWRQPDIVHSILFYASLAAECARGLLRNPPKSIVARHHNLVHHLQAKRLHVRLDAWTARHASRALAVSAAVQRTLLSEGVPADGISVVPNGLDWDQAVVAESRGVNEWRQRFQGRILAVALGRLSPEKDYPSLLRAFAGVSARCGDVHLAIAGAGPDSILGQLVTLCSALGIRRRVTFLGWVANPYDLLLSADVFVQASLDESFSQTIAEAMGLAVPIAATTPAAVPELVLPWYPIVSPGDVLGLAFQITSTLDDLDLAKRRAANIAPIIRSRFSARRMALGYEHAYTSLLSTDIHRSPER